MLIIKMTAKSLKIKNKFIPEIYINEGYFTKL